MKASKLIAILKECNPEADIAVKGVDALFSVYEVQKTNDSKRIVIIAVWDEYDDWQPENPPTYEMFGGMWDFEYGAKYLVPII